MIYLIMKCIKLVDIMERFIIETEIKQLSVEINDLEKEHLKIQTMINTKKMQLNRDQELIEIMDFEDLL